MLIAVDIDGVLADLINPLLSWHNSRYETSLNRSDVSSYHLRNIWGGTGEEEIEKVIEFYDSPFFERVAPISGSQEGVDKLYQDNRLVVLTARFQKVHDNTLKFIGQYFPEKFESVEFTYQWANLRGGNEKANICRRMGVDLIIEDNLDCVRECAEKRVRSILFDSPWNQSNGLENGIERVHSWREIVDKLR